MLVYPDKQDPTRKASQGHWNSSTSSKRKWKRLESMGRDKIRHHHVGRRREGRGGGEDDWIWDLYKNLHFSLAIRQLDKHSLAEW